MYHLLECQPLYRDARRPWARSSTRFETLSQREHTPKASDKHRHMLNIYPCFSQTHCGLITTESNLNILNHQESHNNVTTTAIFCEHTICTQTIFYHQPLEVITGIASQIINNVIVEPRLRPTRRFYSTAKMWYHLGCLIFISGSLQIDFTLDRHSNTQ